MVTLQKANAMKHAMEAIYKIINFLQQTESLGKHNSSSS